MATFKREALQDLLIEGGTEDLGLIDDIISGKSRWSINHNLVFTEKATWRFYRVRYSEGATEQQDERPFEYDGDDIEAEEVRPVKRVVTVYE